MTRAHIRLVPPDPLDAFRRALPEGWTGERIGEQWRAWRRPVGDRLPGGVIGPSGDPDEVVRIAWQGIR